MNIFILFTYKIEENCEEENCEEGELKNNILQDYDENKITTRLLGPINILLLSWLVIIQFMNYTLLNVILGLKQLKDSYSTYRKNSFCAYIKVNIYIYIYYINSKYLE